MTSPEDPPIVDQSELPTENRSEEQQLDQIEVIPFESSAEWVFQWQSELGEYEISYVNAREVWLRKARYTDPDGTRGGWNEPQEIDLELPKTYEDAERIANSYIRRK